MSPAAIFELIAILVLMVFSAFFSASDMAFSVVNPNQLKKLMGVKKTAKLAYNYSKNYEKAITVLLFSNSFVNVVASSLGALLAIHIVNDFNFDPGSEGLISTLVSLVMLLLILTFGEIMPKAIAKTHALGVSMVAAPIVKTLSIVFFPIVFPSTALAKLVTKPVIKRFAENEDTPVKDEELSEMFDAIEEEGIIDEDQSDRLYSALEFKDTTAHEIMTPRVKIEGVEKNTDLMKLISSGYKFKHSRIPVYEGSMDKIIGYIPVKTLLKTLLFKDKVTIESLLTPVLEVPSNMEISAILDEMKHNRRHIAVVKDEWGGTDGILTLEDILEELVGEIYDEHEVVKIDIKKMDKRNHFLVLGTCDIETFFEEFNMDEDDIEEGYETLSGFITHKLNGFASPGDKIKLTRLDIIVRKSTSYTVEEAEVIYHPRRKKVS